MSILEGEELGKVQTMLIDPDRGLVIGFILSTRDMDRGIRVVPYNKVSSFGSFAITVSRASDVTDLAANPYFMELFERDAVLIGCKVVESGGKVVGYVRDIAIDSQDGAIILLKLSSDVGFMSPYRATAPFKAIDKMESDTITLKQSEQINFKKDTPGGEEGYSYVPLVVEESGIKDALEQRLIDEMEKVQRDAMKRLESEYERFFLKHHKETLSLEIQDSLKELFGEKIQEALTLFRESIIGELKTMLDQRAPIGKTEEKAAARDGADETDRRINSALTPMREQLENRLEEVSRGLDALSGRANKLDQELEVHSELQLPEEKLRGLIESRLDVLKKSMEGAVPGVEKLEASGNKEVLESMRELIEKQAGAISALGGKIADLEKRETAFAGDTAPGVAAIIESRFESLRTEIDKKLEAANAAVSNATDSVTDELRTQIQSGAWKQAMREFQIESLRKAVEGGREAEGVEKDETPVSDEDAIDVYGIGIAGKLIGKRVSRDIYAGADLIIHKGRVIDDGVVETAKVHGKFIELSLSVIEE